MQAVRVAAGGDGPKAERSFGNLGKEVKAYEAIDDLQQYVVAHSDEIDEKGLFESALYMVMDSSDSECVKYGLSILGVFDANVVLKDVVRTIGLCDEFTFFSVSAMLN